MSMGTRTFSSTPPATTGSTGWNIALWIGQVALAFVFGMAGGMKMLMPMHELAQSAPFAAEAPEWLIRFIGTCEVLGAFGVIVPALTRVAPILTPMAAIGLTTVMVLATLFHASRSEFTSMPLPIGLGILAAFVAWGRLRKAPILSRT